LADGVVERAYAASRSEGVIDLRARRYMIDFGAYAELYADGRQWGGRSGRSLASLSPDTKHVRETPWRLLDLVGAIRAAHEIDREEIRGEICTRFTADVATDRLTTTLPAGWLDDPAGPRLEVWIAEHYVRRVRVHAEQRTQTLELWDIGTPTDALDWARLPTFRSDERADAA
jgi:hypothetical protein